MFFVKLVKNSALVSVFCAMYSVVHAGVKFTDIPENADFVIIVTSGKNKGTPLDYITQTHYQKYNDKYIKDIKEGFFNISDECTRILDAGRITPEKVASPYFITSLAFVARVNSLDDITFRLKVTGDFDAKLLVNAIYSECKKGDEDNVFSMKNEVMTINIEDSQASSFFTLRAIADNSLVLASGEYSESFKPISTVEFERMKISREYSTLLINAPRLQETFERAGVEMTKDNVAKFEAAVQPFARIKSFSLLSKDDIDSSNNTLTMLSANDYDAKAIEATANVMIAIGKILAEGLASDKTVSRVYQPYKTLPSKMLNAVTVNASGATVKISSSTDLNVYSKLLEFVELDEPWDDCLEFIIDFLNKEDAVEVEAFVEMLHELGLYEKEKKFESPYYR